MAGDWKRRPQPRSAVHPEQHGHFKDDYSMSGESFLGGTWRFEEVIYVSFFAFLLLLIAYVTAFFVPYWQVGLDSNVGLWESCSQGLCYGLAGQRASDWLLACQFMMSFGLITGVFAGALLATWVVMSIRRYPMYRHPTQTCLFTMPPGYLTISTGMMGMIGAIVWGTGSRELVSNFSSVPSGWAFWLNLVSCLFLIPLGFLLLYTAHRLGKKISDDFQ